MKCINLSSATLGRVSHNQPLAAFAAFVMTVRRHAGFFIIFQSLLWTDGPEYLLSFEFLLAGKAKMYGAEGEGERTAKVGQYVDSP